MRQVEPGECSSLAGPIEEGLVEGMRDRPRRSLPWRAGAPLDSPGPFWRRRSFFQRAPATYRPATISSPRITWRRILVNASQCRLG